MERFCNDADTSPATTGRGSVRDRVAVVGMRLAAARPEVVLGLEATMFFVIGASGGENSIFGNSCPQRLDTCQAALGAGDTA
jgi:hypothetical protein